MLKATESRAHVKVLQRCTAEHLQSCTVASIVPAHIHQKGNEKCECAHGRPQERWDQCVSGAVSACTDHHTSHANAHAHAHAHAHANIFYRSLIQKIYDTPTHTRARARELCRILHPFVKLLGLKNSWRGNDY